MQHEPRWQYIIGANEASDATYTGKFSYTAMGDEWNGAERSGFGPRIEIVEAHRMGFFFGKDILMSLPLTVIENNRVRHVLLAYDRTSGKEIARLETPEILDKSLLIPLLSLNKSPRPRDEASISSCVFDGKRMFFSTSADRVYAVEVVR